MATNEQKEFPLHIGWDEADIIVHALRARVIVIRYYTEWEASEKAAAIADCRLLANRIYSAFPNVRKEGQEI